MRYEFDHYETPKCLVGVCQVRLVADKNSEMDAEVVLSLDGKEHVIMQAWRDQWGVYITVGDICVAQEDGTRSFIDGLIKCLQKFREQNEFETTDATPMQENQS